MTERGVCWSISSNPTTSDSHQTASAGGTGSFTVTIEGLNAGVTYHVRAYAINSQGKSYGEDKTFTTGVSAPMVTTLSVWNVSMNAASCDGNVIDGGGVTVTERGVCWSTDHNPTTSGDHKAASLAGTGEFTVNVTGLTPNTNYYVRAYAKNSEGTNYGSELFFRTLSFPEGAINGLFSVSAIQQVWFSQGNLQYIGSARTWKFADHQWDVIGDSQGNNSQSITRDLFGWGTSGYNHGAVCYQPWSISKKYEDYFAYGQYTYNLFDQTGQADWGYNAISNGGNQTNQWRTLTHEEWVYVFNTRITSSGIRYAKAKVDNVNGVILLPDEWNTSFYSLSNANDGGASFTSNTISDSQWADLEQHGAVFLPAAGGRYGTSVGNVGSLGFYWSSSCSYSDLAYHVFFSDEGLGTDNFYYRELGHSVRLVCSSW